jgi:hypothetical protein
VKSPGAPRFLSFVSGCRLASFPRPLEVIRSFGDRSLVGFIQWVFGRSGYRLACGTPVRFGTEVTLVQFRGPHPFVQTLVAWVLFLVSSVGTSPLRSFWVSLAFRTTTWLGSSSRLLFVMPVCDSIVGSCFISLSF